MGDDEGGHQGAGGKDCFVGRSRAGYSNPSFASRRTSEWGQLSSSSRSTRAEGQLGDDGLDHLDVLGLFAPQFLEQRLYLRLVHVTPRLVVERKGLSFG